MSEARRIAELYRSVYEGDDKGQAWHGPALKSLLKGVTPEQAFRSPITGGHSILQLVLHLAYWEEIILRRFQREIVDAPLNSADDWPPNRKLTDSDWNAALFRLERSHTALHKCIENCSDEALKQTVPDRNYDNYMLLHGIIHHCVYHSAQIALTKKSLS